MMTRCCASWMRRWLPTFLSGAVLLALPPLRPHQRQLCLLPVLPPPVPLRFLLPML